MRSVCEGLSGDRYLLLDGIETLPLPVLPEFEAVSPGYRFHTLKVQLRVFGDPRKTSEHSYTTVYPHSALDKKTTTSRVGQLSLPIPDAVLEVPQAVNPVIVKWKPKQKLKPKQGIQLSLPVAGLEALVFELRQENRPYLPPVSSQELLAEKVTTWSKRARTEVELPQVMVDLLNNQGADQEEWQSAIDLFGVTGLAGAMRYVDGIPYFRKHKGLAVSTAAESAAIPVVAATIATNVTVKAFR